MVNEVTLVGNVGKDPEITYTQSGKARTKFSVATNSKWKAADGTKQEKVAWHNVVVWDELAKICAEYLRKGRQVYVKGEIEYREYEKDGIKRYMTEIKAVKVVFLGDSGRQGGDSGRQGGSPAQDARPPETGKTPPPGATSEAAEAWDDPDDLPF